MSPKPKRKKVVAKTKPAKGEAYVYEKVGYKGMFAQFKLIYFRPEENGREYALHVCIVIGLRVGLTVVAFVCLSSC